MLQLKLHPVDRQFQETRSMFLRNIFFPAICFVCAFPSRDDFRELNHRKQLIPRKSKEKKSLKAIYKRTAISNNAHCNGLLHSKNISSMFVKVSSDPRINLRGGTWHSFVNHISSIEVPFEVIIPWDFIQLFLADLRWRIREFPQTTWPGSDYRPCRIIRPGDDKWSDRKN